jgi:hypothetical protein
MKISIDHINGKFSEHLKSKKMTLKFKITATAPTSYQYSSLTKFNLDKKENANGSITGQRIFDTKEEAKQYLIDRAKRYYDEYEGQVDEHLEDIENYDCLTIDAVTARIEEELIPSGKFALAFDAGHKGTRYIDQFDEKHGTGDVCNAMEFDSEEEAHAYADKYGYVCWVESI